MCLVKNASQVLKNPGENRGPVQKQFIHLFIFIYYLFSFFVCFLGGDTQWFIF